jgi:hypothetical protein
VPPGRRRFAVDGQEVAAQSDRRDGCDSARRVPESNRVFTGPGSSPAACADIPEIAVRNSGIPEIIRDFLFAGISRVILP